MNKLECKIVQDLLPAYIDKLTSPETNEFIEKHLQECKECQKDVEIMKKGLEMETKKMQHQVDYLKKYKRKILIAKIIISIAIIITCIFLGIKIYQLQFLTQIFEHNINYEIGSNYKLIERSGSEGLTNETVCKDGTGYAKLNNGTIIWEDNNSKLFINTNERKYFELDKNSPPIGMTDSIITIQTQNLFNIENKNELIKRVLLNHIDIHEEEYRDRKCYVILYEGEKIWIDKKNLFIIRDDYQGKSTDYTIEINTVTDEEVQLPDLQEYDKINQ